MRKDNMKKMDSQKIVVKLAKDNISEFDISPELFEDPYLEAATRALEKNKEHNDLLPRLLIECWNKKTPKKVVLYNSYKVLINASKFALAEKLREKTLVQSDCDLAKQPLHD